MERASAPEVSDEAARAAHEWQPQQKLGGRLADVRQPIVQIHAMISS